MSGAKLMGAALLLTALAVPATAQEHEGHDGEHAMHHAAPPSSGHPAAILEGLEHSFMHARHSIADIPDSELDARVRMFGQDATKRQVLTVLNTHMHEHLGQAIAYARSNGVTPPWSQGR